MQKLSRQRPFVQFRCTLLTFVLGNSSTCTTNSVSKGKRQMSSLGHTQWLFILNTDIDINTWKL